MKKPTLWSLLGVLSLVSTAHADYSLKAYKDAKATGGETWEEMKLYLLGLSNGYGYANGELLRKHQPPLFCQPESLGLNVGNVIDILDNTIAALTAMKGTPPSDSTVIDYTLLQGLEVTFPCKPTN